MPTQLSHVSTSLLSCQASGGSSLLSVAQQVLTDLGWEDLRPAIYAAAQVDQEAANELQTAYVAYTEEYQDYQLQHLQKVLDKTIEKLQSDCKRVNQLKDEAEQRLSLSREISLRGSIYHRTQQFFGSDPASLVARYSEIAQNRRASIAALKHYRDSINERLALGIKTEEENSYSHTRSLLAADSGLTEMSIGVEF